MIGDRVLSEHDPCDENNPMAVLRPEHTPVLDDDRLLVSARSREEVLLVLGSRHGGSLDLAGRPSEVKKADRFGCAPPSRLGPPSKA